MNYKQQIIFISFFTLLITFGTSFLIIWKLKPRWALDPNINYLKICIYSLLISIIFASSILIIFLQNKFKVRRKLQLNLYKD